MIQKEKAIKKEKRNRNWKKDVKPTKKNPKREVWKWKVKKEGEKREKKKEDRYSLREISVMTKKEKINSSKSNREIKKIKQSYVYDK